jgi:hypothetical protein
MRAGHDKRVCTSLSPPCHGALMSLSLEADSCAMLLDPRTVSYISLFSLFMPKGKAFYYSNAKWTKIAYLCNKLSHGKEKWFNQPFLVFSNYGNAQEIEATFISSSFIICFIKIDVQRLDMLKTCVFSQPQQWYLFLLNMCFSSLTHIPVLHSISGVSDTTLL